MIPGDSTGAQALQCVSIERPQPDQDTDRVAELEVTIHQHSRRERGDKGPRTHRLGRLALGLSERLADELQIDHLERLDGSVQP
ncbi:MAG: hypothetical protein ACOCWF_03025, partial [Halochromatium sp.]